MKKKLKDFPILHRFYAELIGRSGLTTYDCDEILKKIKNYHVTKRCPCTDKNCATVYFQREQQLEDDIVEILPFDKAFVILHFNADGGLVLESLDSCEYPYVKELRNVLENDKPSKVTEKEAKSLVDAFFFNIKDQALDAIIID